MVAQTRVPGPFRLESNHARAIGNEIGEHLPQHLERETAPVPPHLRRLLDRFVEMERREIVPERH
jgi:hypothetical protein